MVRSSRLLLSAAVCGIIGLGAIPAQAVDVDIEATLNASPSLNIAPAVNLDFASVDFAAIHSGAIQVGPDANAALVGATGLNISGTPVAGQIDITESTETLDISCDLTATISDGTVDLTVTEIVWDPAAVAPAYGAAANTCAGLGAGIIQIDTSIPANADPTLNIGAELTIGANVLNASGSATYDSSTGAGDPITFRIVVN